MQTSQNMFFDILFDDNASPAEKTAAVAAAFDDCVSPEELKIRMGQYAEFRQFLENERVQLAAHTLETVHATPKPAEDGGSLKDRFLHAYNALDKLGNNLNDIAKHTRTLQGVFNIMAQAETCSLAFGTKVSPDTERTLRQITMHVEHADSFRKSHAKQMAVMRRTRDQF